MQTKAFVSGLPVPACVQVSSFNVRGAIPALQASCDWTCYSWLTMAFSVGLTIAFSYILLVGLTIAFSYILLVGLTIAFSSTSHAPGMLLTTPATVKMVLIVFYPT